MTQGMCADPRVVLRLCELAPCCVSAGVVVVGHKCKAAVDGGVLPVHDQLNTLNTCRAASPCTQDMQGQRIQDTCMQDMQGQHMQHRCMQDNISAHARHIHADQDKRSLSIGGTNAGQAEHGSPSCVLKFKHFQISGTEILVPAKEAAAMLVYTYPAYGS